jgi:hypothetical protein
MTAKAWQNQLNGDPLPWLLEEESPGVRFLTLRDLLDCPEEDPELRSARSQAYTHGPIAEILANMYAEGYWVEPGPGYNPKYRSTVWAVILLAQLGASALQDEQVAQACSYILDHALTSGGQFSTSGAPSGTVDCLQGNLCWALVQMQYEDPRLDLAYEWMARSLTGEGVAPASDRQAALRYYAGKCGPLFACGANNKLACAWGATKVMQAFSVWPEDRRTPLIENAIQQGIGFLLGTDPAEANYPSGWSDKPSGNWWKFGFPVFYVTDLLQIVEALVGLGYGRDPRLENALSIVRQKQDPQGRWALEYDYTGKTWVNFGAKKKPNPWVTLRALRVLKALEG